jgi:hypothetical protein
MANHSRNFISRRWGAAYEETQPHRTEQSNETPFSRSRSSQDVSDG